MIGSQGLHRIIFLFLIATITISSLFLLLSSEDSCADTPITDDGSAGEDVTWTYSRYTGVITFSGTGEMYDYEIMVEDPKDPRGKPPKWSTFEITRAIFSEGITHIGKSTLRYNRGVTNISLPSTLISIGQNAFSGTAIQSIEIPPSVESIGLMAFSNTALREVVVPDNVTDLGASAFAKCLYLKRITIGSGVTEINQGLFANTPRLESVELGPNTLRLNRWLTSDSGLQSIYIPASVEWISSSAFSARSPDKLKEIIIDEANTIYRSIDGVLYDYDMTELIRFLPAMDAQTFIIPESVHYLGDNCFLYSDNLEHISLPNCLEYIGSNSFTYCTSLKEVIIPDSVIQVARDGIATGGTLDLLQIGEGITEVTAYSFPSISDVKVISIGTSVIKMETSALHYNASLCAIEVDKDSLHYASASGILYNANMTQLLVVPRCITGSITLPESVTHIADNAFLSSALDNVVLSGNLQVLGNCSFKNSSIMTAIIPDTVKIIGNDTYEGCSDLAFVYFIGRYPPSIGTDAFDTGAELRIYSSMQRGFVDAYSSNPELISYYESEIFYTDAADRIMHGQDFIVAVILVMALSLIIGEYLVKKRHGRN